jgi:serine/threonine protein kinase
MTGPRVSPPELRFCTTDGTDLEVGLKQADEWQSVNPLLRSRRVTLEPWDGPSPLWMLAVAESLDVGPRWRAYELLDNEILAGLRLARLASQLPGDGFSDGYPECFSRLVGYQAFDADQYVLLEPYRGTPVFDHAGRLLQNDQLSFIKQLVIGLRWLQHAGLAHRLLSPSTVRWSDKGVQITTFSQSTLIGTPRTFIGRGPWTAPEQRAPASDSSSAELVTDRDDIWATARLICYVIAGFELTTRQQLDQYHLSELLGDALGPPPTRPEALTLLARLRLPDPLRTLVTADDALQRGRAAFDRIVPPPAPSSAETPQFIDLTNQPESSPPSADLRNDHRTSRFKPPWR